MLECTWGSCFFQRLAVYWHRATKTHIMRKTITILVQHRHWGENVDEKKGI